MLNKIEFSDLYKFLTSVGLITIASSFLIPWLFMRQDIGLLISNTEYNELVESSKNLTDSRINLGLLITKLLPYVSGTLFILGVITTGIGISKWKKKQDTLDETDELRLTELKAKIKELDTNEILEKAESEVKKEIALESDSASKDSIYSTKDQKLDIEELKTNLLDMEKLFFDKIINFNSFVYEAKSNVKLDNEYEIDIMLKSLNHSKHPDVFIEVKYIQSKLKISIVREAFSYLVRAYNHYKKVNNRILKTILIVVYKHDIAEPSEINRFLQATNEHAAKFKGRPYEILTMTDKQAEDFDIKKIIK